MSIVGATAFEPASTALVLTQALLETLAIPDSNAGRRLVLALACVIRKIFFR